MPIGAARRDASSGTAAHITMLAHGRRPLDCAQLLRDELMLQAHHGIVRHCDYAIASGHAFIALRPADRMPGD